MRLLQYIGIPLFLSSCRLTAARCPWPCYCSESRSDCSRRRLNSPPVALPNSTKMLDLKGNYIQKLQSPSTVDLKQLNLTHLIASDNRIAMLGANMLPRTLRHLDLRGNQLRFLPQTALRGLVNLQFLDLTSNKLRSMSRWLWEVPRLFNLLLSGNAIRRIGDRDLKYSRKLQYLNVAQNQVRKVHRRAFRWPKTLRHIQLSDNPIKRMPKFVDFRGGGLEYLELRNCSLYRAPRGLAGKAAATFLQDNHINKLVQSNFSPASQSQRIILEHNRVRATSRGAFRGASEVMELSLNHNRLQYVPAYLPPQLRLLRLANNRFKQIIIHKQHKNCSLRHLDLSHNNIRSLHPYSFYRLHLLESLNLVKNRLQVISPYALNDLGHLKRLELGHNPLIVLSYDCFHGLGNLHQLNLGSVHDHIMIQGPVLRPLGSMKQLELQASPHIARWLLSDPYHCKNLTSLEDLGLQSCAVASLPSLDMLPSLKHLRLDNNPLRCDGAVKWLLQWIKGSSAAHNALRHLRCASPAQMEGKYISSLNMKDIEDSKGKPAFAQTGLKLDPKKTSLIEEMLG